MRFNKVSASLAVASVLPAINATFAESDDGLQSVSDDCDKLCRQRFLYRLAYSSVASGVGQVMAVYDSFEWCASQHWCEPQIHTYCSALAQELVKDNRVAEDPCGEECLIHEMAIVSQWAGYGGMLWANATVNITKDGQLLAPERLRKLELSMAGLEYMPETIVNSTALEAAANNDTVEELVEPSNTGNSTGRHDTHHLKFAETAALLMGPFLSDCAPTLSKRGAMGAPCKASKALDSLLRGKAGRYIDKMLRVAQKMHVLPRWSWLRQTLKNWRQEARTAQETVTDDFLPWDEGIPPEAMQKGAQDVASKVRDWISKDPPLRSPGSNIATLEEAMQQTTANTIGDGVVNGHPLYLGERFDVVSERIHTQILQRVQLAEGMAGPSDRAFHPMVELGDDMKPLMMRDGLGRKVPQIHWRRETDLQTLNEGVSNWEELSGSGLAASSAEMPEVSISSAGGLATNSLGEPIVRVGNEIATLGEGKVTADGVAKFTLFTRLGKIKDWFSGKKLSFNPKKTGKDAVSIEQAGNKPQVQPTDDLNGSLTARPTTAAATQEASGSARETTKPEETTKLEQAVKPEETTKSEQTAKPKKTTTPEKTIMPEKTSTTEKTTALDKTTTPVKTLNPGKSTQISRSRGTSSLLASKSAPSDGTAVSGTTTRDLSTPTTSPSSGAISSDTQITSASTLNTPKSSSTRLAQPGKSTFPISPHRPTTLQTTASTARTSEPSGWAATRGIPRPTMYDKCPTKPWASGVVWSNPVRDGEELCPVPIPWECSEDWSNMVPDLFKSVGYPSYCKLPNPFPLHEVAVQKGCMEGWTFRSPECQDLHKCGRINCRRERHGRE